MRADGGADEGAGDEYHLTVPKNLVTRREFVVGSAAALAGASLRAQGQVLTAQQVADRIRAEERGPARRTTVDGIKAGDPSTPVTGIAVTVMATVDVLRAAAEARRNFVVTYEPVFYTATDDPGPRASDPVYLAKKTLIDERRLVVYRLFDQWNARPYTAGADYLARLLGWNPTTPSSGQVYDVRETTLGELAKVGGLAGVRTVGDPSMRVRRVFVNPGTASLADTMRGLERADAAIVGEAREWEAVPYVLDSAAASRPKGMILFGRIVSEDPGNLQVCAEWLKGVVPEVPAQYQPMPDPYWKPL